MNRLANRLDDLSRRDFIAASAKALLGVSCLSLFGGLPLHGDEPQPAGGAPRRPTARNCIYIYLAGGMSHLDTFDLKPGAETQGPTTAIASKADGIQISEYLPKLAEQMRHVAVIRSMSSTQGAHEPGNYYMHTSYTLRGTIRHPAMGAWLSYLGGRGNPTLPSNIVIGGGSQHPGSGFLESKFAPLPLGNPEAGLQHSALSDGVTEAQFDRRMALAEQFNQGFQKQYDQKQVRAYRDLYGEAVRLMGSKDLKAFDIAQEPEALKAAYGEDPFGQGCLLARRLVENDVRFVEVTLGGWDTHDDNFDRVSTRCMALDQGLSALLADLSSRGLLDETLVVVATEFGRSPKINSNNGRDHYPKAFSCLLAGGGIKGGQVHGATDETGAQVVSGRVLVPDFNATIGYALGLPLDKVVISPQGRPFTVADKGRPLTNLF
jgi:hypothetical protein